MKSRKYILPALVILLVLSFALATNAQTSTTNAQTTSTTPAPADGVARIALDEFKTLLAGKTPPFVIDVRYNPAAKIKGATLIPFGEIESRLSEIPRDREIVTYCS